MTTTPIENHVQECIEAEAAVVATRLAVGGALWCVALLAIDRTSLPASDPYVTNMRLGLWLFLLELLVGAYYVRYTLPASFPKLKRAAFVLSEMFSSFRNIAIWVVINLVLRWFFVALGTAFLIFLFGESWIVRVGAIFPSLAFLAAWFGGLGSVVLPPVIRGTHLGSMEEAITRAGTLLLQAMMAVKARLTHRASIRLECCPCRYSPMPSEAYCFHSHFSPPIPFSWECPEAERRCAFECFS